MKPVSATHLSCGCDWDGKRWTYCGQHKHLWYRLERPDAAVPREIELSDDIPTRAGDPLDEFATPLPMNASPPSDTAPVALQEAAVEALVAIREMAKEEKVSARLMLGIDASITLHTALANAHPEDALKQTPEHFTESGDVKGDLHPEDAPGGPTRLQVLEAQRELTAADVAFPHEDGTYSLLLSDTFDFASADAERIPDDEVIRLAQLYKDHGWDALMVWAEDKRGQRVLKPLRKAVDKMRDRLKGDENG